MRDEADPPPEARAEAEAEAPPHLVYVSDATPGISRRRCGRGFAYRDPDGRPVPASERARIAALGVPPAYERVWICPLPNGHLQATGFDARGRKQYRYHADWAGWRDAAKYGQLAAFGAALGRLRRRVERDLRAEAGDLALSLAALTLLLDRAHLRVGGASYAAENKSFGATTLLKRHLRLEDGVVRLDYRAKGGVRVRQTLRDRRLHRILQEIGDLPGRNLFTYVTPLGEPRPVASQHVNAYVAEATGLPGVSAKTFRTWGGTLAAFGAARAAEGRLTVREMARASAEALANTPAISRASYIHPAVLALAGLPADERRALLDRPPPAGDPRLRADERRLIAFLAATAA
jgi:DNA topoisomerase-1